MSKMSQKKAKKKKEREKESRKKVLERREVLRAPKIEENKLQKKMKRISKLQKDMEGLNQWADEVLVKMSDKTLNQLERNAKILKALEDEYEKEKAKKTQLNNDLESKGLYALEEKLNFLHNELVEQQRSVGIEVLGENIVPAQKSKSKPSEVAEVTVCKAPGFEVTEEKSD